METCDLKTPLNMVRQPLVKPIYIVHL